MVNLDYVHYLNALKKSHRFGTSLLFVRFFAMKPFSNFRQKFRDKPGNINEISMPNKVERLIHVEYDTKTKTYIGLPPAWLKLISAANFTEEELMSHTQDIVNSCETHDKIVKQQEQEKFMGVSGSSLDDLGKFLMSHFHLTYLR